MNIRSYLSVWSFYILIDVIINSHTKNPEFAHAWPPRTRKTQVSTNLAGSHDKINTKFIKGLMA